MRTLLLLASVCFLLLLNSCQGTKSSEVAFKEIYKDSLLLQKDTIILEKVPEKTTIKYHFEFKDVWKQKDSFVGYEHQFLLAAINRVDVIHLKRLDSFLVPDIFVDSLVHYFPFPLYSKALEQINKIIIFSYASQSFAAYENGTLIFVGPTNMGKKATKTPKGLFFCNWKAKEIRSTVDNDWILKWNFNVSNFGGVGFHEYSLPGYPASHSCMRLLSEHAKFLYDWASQWKLSKDGKLLAQGTPVVIYGEYPFGHPRPWFALADDSKGLEVSEQELIDLLSPIKDQILQEQEKRENLFPKIADSTTFPIVSK